MPKISYAEDGDNMTSLTKNIWKKDDRGVPKKQSLETIMAEQSLLDNVTPTPTVTKALTEDLQALVDRGIITVMEALELMPQSDEKCLGDTMETVANNLSGPQLSDDLLNMVREGLISMADATMMQSSPVASNTQTNAPEAPGTQSDEMLARLMQMDEDRKAREMHEEAARQSNRRYGSIKIQFSTSLDNTIRASSGACSSDINDDENDNDGDYLENACNDDTKFHAHDINKHSAEVSGKRNRKRLEKNTISSSLGQMSDDTTLNNSVYNSINEFLKKQNKADGRGISGRNAKELRKTKQGAFDARTQRCILKLVNRGVIDNVNNIIRVGKEACVCSAYGYGMNIEAGSRDEGGRIDDVPQKQHLAVKLFFTTLSDFKNRSEYVDGDPRYHNSHFSDQQQNSGRC